MSDKLQPKDHAEAVALFRSEIVGALVHRELRRGELRAALRTISQQRFRPPGSDITRSFSVTTLERWLYRLRRGGLAALRPRPRSDRGRAQALTAEQRELLLDIRREHRSASVPLILRTLELDGRLERGSVSAATVRRLYVEHGLDRVPLRDGSSPRMRLRWQAERPGALWHGDVCHVAPLIVGERRLPVRIHALLDDASRYIVAIEARHSERETDMLGLLVGALRRHGSPDALFLDNGGTYRGDILRIACGRLGVSLLHARPHDPEARAKMERFWRTLREGCTDYLAGATSLHDINVRLFAFIDQHYHQAPHAGLLGQSPASVWQKAEQGRPIDAIDEQKLRDALTVRVRRRVRRDNTLSVEGHDFQLDQGFLAGRIVQVAYCALDEPPVPWAEHDGDALPLHTVDPVRNSKLPRPSRRQGEATAPKGVLFDPASALLARAVGRNPREEGSR